MSNEVTAPAKPTLGELLRRKADREAKLDEEAEARQLLELELEEQYSASLGPRGQAFEIVTSVEGPVVVKIGDDLGFKKMRTAYDNGKSPNVEQLFAYVAPCVVYPERAKFAEIIARRPGLLVACSDAEAILHRGVEREVRGKS
jgi:hypothetical protein